MIQKLVLLVALLFVHAQAGTWTNEDWKKLPPGPKVVGPGRCDKDYIVLSDMEVNSECKDDCWYNKYKCNKFTTATWMGQAPLAERSMDCNRKCNNECNRCDPDGFDQRAHQPSCPEPQCLIETKERMKCHATCGGLSKRVQMALTKRYKTLGLETGVVGTNNICFIFCTCKFSGPRGFRWHGESLCANLTPMPFQRRLRASLYDFDDDSVW